MKKLITLWTLIILLVTGCAPAGFPELAPADGILKVVFIDVDQGDSALIIAPDGTAMLIDGGVPGAFKTVDQVMAAYGVKKLKVMVGTHAHDDHIGGLVNILNKYPVAQLYSNGQEDSRVYSAFLSAARVQGLSPQPLQAGDFFQLTDQVVCDVLGPEKAQESQGNAASIVLRLRYGDHSFLFTGDAEKGEERAIVDRYGHKIRSTVVKVGHHGSATSSSPAFVQAVAPHVAIISVGENSYNHPDNLVIKRWQQMGAEVYTTESSGHLALESDGDKLYLAAQKTSQALAA